MENQKYNEYRVNELPSSGLEAGDKYYLNLGNGEFRTYIVSDDLELLAEAGSEPIFYIPISEDEYFDI